MAETEQYQAEYAVNPDEKLAQTSERVGVVPASEISAVPEKTELLRGISVVAADDSKEYLARFLPYLIGATAGAGDAVWVRPGMSSEDIVSKITALHPDVVLMDGRIELGEGKWIFGYELVPDVLAQNPGVKVYGWSLGSGDVKNEFKAAGALEMVKKADPKGSLQELARLMSEKAQLSAA